MTMMVSVTKRAFIGWQQGPRRPGCLWEPDTTSTRAAVADSSQECRQRGQQGRLQGGLCRNGFFGKQHSGLLNIPEYGRAAPSPKELDVRYVQKGTGKKLGSCHTEHLLGPPHDGVQAPLA